MHDQNHLSNLTRRQSNNKGTHTLRTHVCIAACILVHRSRCVHPSQYCVHGARLFTHRAMHGCRNATQYACMLFARCSHCHTSKNLQIPACECNNISHRIARVHTLTWKHFFHTSPKYGYTPRVFTRLLSRGQNVRDTVCVLP